MAFRRELLTEQGGFDPALGPGTLAHDGDDIEALLRVLLSGRQVVHDPAAIVWHAHPRDYGELEQRVWGYGDRPHGLPDEGDRRPTPACSSISLRKLPRGVAFALSPRSAKNVGRQSDFPSALVRLELRGMAYGPIAYARSRWHQRRRASPLRIGPAAPRDRTAFLAAGSDGHRRVPPVHRRRRPMHRAVCAGALTAGPHGGDRHRVARRCARLRR